MGDGITTKIHKKGYVYQYVSGRGWVLQHRLVMAELLGRPLEHHEQVHHINGDKADNCPENLHLFPWAGDHSRLHNTLTRWSRHHDTCVHCSTTARKHVGRGLCTLCHQRDQNGTTGLIGTWANRYDACLACGFATRKHYGRGLCSRCYLRDRREQGLR